MKKAVIAAAGRGTRSGLSMPKCLYEINGKTILQSQLDSLKDYEVYVIVGYEKDQILRRYGNSVRPIINNEYDKTNTAGSLARAAEIMTGNVLILDGDVWLRPTTFPEYDFIGYTDPKSEMPVYIKERNGLARGFTKEETNLEWCGITRCDIQLFKYCRNEYIYNVLEPILPLPAMKIDCLEIDTPEDMKVAQHWTT